MSACTCKKDIEARLLDHFKSSAPEASGHSAKLQGYAVMLGGLGLISKPFMAYKTTATYPLKKGGSKERSVTGNMIFSHCPFCGISLKKVAA